MCNNIIIQLLYNDINIIFLFCFLREIERQREQQHSCEIFSSVQYLLWCHDKNSCWARFQKTLSNVELRATAKQKTKKKNNEKTTKRHKITKQNKKTKERIMSTNISTDSNILQFVVFGSFYFLPWFVCYT